MNSTIRIISLSFQPCSRYYFIHGRYHIGCLSFFSNGSGVFPGITTSAQYNYFPGHDGVNKNYPLISFCFFLSQHGIRCAFLRYVKNYKCVLWPPVFFLIFVLQT